jgi:hypothetical protein
MVMPDFNFDPSTALDAYRSVFAPTLRAQQEALKTMERFGRYQFAVATDYLEWGVAQAKANLNLSTPAARSIRLDCPAFLVDGFE